MGVVDNSQKNWSQKPSFINEFFFFFCVARKKKKKKCCHHKTNVFGGVEEKAHRKNVYWGVGTAKGSRKYLALNFSGMNEEQREGEVHEGGREE